MCARAGLGFIPVVDSNASDTYNRVRANGFRVLALAHFEAEALWYSLRPAVSRMKELSPEKLHRLLGSSGLHAWLRVVEAQVSGRPDWFADGFARWISLKRDDLIRFLCDYLESSVAVAETGDARCAVRLAPGKPGVVPRLLGPGQRIAVDGSICVDASDPFLLADFDGVETLPRETRRSAQRALASTAKEALARVARWRPAMRAEISALVREVVPCRSPAPPAFPSGSCTMTPAAVFVTCTPEPDAVAEMLIHETAHIGLSLRDSRTPLAGAEGTQDPWDDESWYSPWRDRPRSLMGVVHAIHAFSRALDYHRWRVETDSAAGAFSAARLSTLHAQLRLVRASSRIEPMLSPSGLAVITDADALIVAAAASARRAAATGIAPCFAERHREWTPPPGDVESAVAAHRAWYLHSRSSSLQ